MSALATLAGNLGLDAVEEIVLMERQDAGLTVEIILAESEVWLGVSMDEEHRAVRLDPACTLDAFHHPMIYVEDAAAFS